MRKIEMMTVEEVAELMRLHPNTARAMADDGRLPGVKVGNQWRFRRDAIEAMTQPADKAAA